MNHKQPRLLLLLPVLSPMSTVKIKHRRRRGLALQRHVGLQKCIRLDRGLRMFLPVVDPVDTMFSLFTFPCVCLRYVYECVGSVVHVGFCHV